MDSIQKRRNRVKQWLRIRLGIFQIRYKPLLVIPLVFNMIFAVAVWKVKERGIAMIEVPARLFSIYKLFIDFFAVILPLLIFLSLLDIIGNLTARKDEQNLAEAFDNHDLRNGRPMLMSKERLKGSNVTKREFYSAGIPMKVWIEKQEDIADSMNVHFVEPLRYGGKSNGRRIVMYTAPGRENALRGDLYDNEL